MARFKSVIVAGEPAAGKATLANAIANETGWTRHSVMAEWRFKYNAAQSNKHVSFGEYLREIPFEGHIKAAREVAELAARGNIVIDTIYPITHDETYLIFHDETSLKVFLRASFETRLERASARAEYGLMKGDNLRAAFRAREDAELEIGRALASERHVPPGGYRFTLNTERMTVEEELKFVRGTLLFGERRRSA